MSNSCRDERPHHVGGKALEVEEYAGYVSWTWAYLAQSKQLGRWVQHVPNMGNLANPAKCWQHTFLEKWWRFALGNVPGGLGLGGRTKLGRWVPSGNTVDCSLGGSLTQCCKLRCIEPSPHKGTMLWHLVWRRGFGQTHIKSLWRNGVLFLICNIGWFGNCIVFSRYSNHQMSLS